MAQLIALTPSSWINAWTLRRACVALDMDLRVPAAGRLLPLPAMAPNAYADWLFFTEEDSLRKALQLSAPARSAVPRFLPERFPLELLDDKWAFAEFLATDAEGPQGLLQWSLANAADADFPLLLKCRHSWAAGRKLPRGWVCRDAAELAAHRSRLIIDGLDETWFFLQAWLGDEPMQLLSVAGFFDVDDEERNQAVVTKRVASYSAGPSSSAAVVTVGDTHGLVAWAERVLRRLHFRGPYEIEFILAGGRCQALELNPRFWMQHGLFEASGNGLVKRYLGLDTRADRKLPAPADLLWVDGFWLWRRLLHADPRPVALWWRWIWQRGFRAVVCPSMGFALQSALWRVAGRLQRSRAVRSNEVGR